MKKEKAKKILMIIGLAICMATLAVSIVFIAKIIELDVLRKTLIGVIIALASVLLIIIGITQRWIVPGIITKIVAIAMIVAMMFCINYINITTKALDKISNMKTEISNVRVYVMKDSAIDKLQARHAMMLIKSFNEWRKQRKREGVVHANHQLVFPAFMQFDRLLFQFSHGMQNFPPFL